MKPPIPTELPIPAIMMRRAITANVLAAVDIKQRGAIKIAEDRWPHDRSTPMLLRAATSPADTTSSGWADTLAGQSVSAFVGSLEPQSAAARLFANAGAKISLSGRDTVLIPRRGKAANTVVWVEQGAPIPTKQWSIDSAQLGPVKKLPLMAGVTRELIERAGGDEVITTLIGEDLAASLDASVFNNTTGAVQPDGLLATATSVTASAATDLGAAMLEDLEQLAGVITDGGGSNVVYVASPRQAASAKLRLLTAATIWPCPALAAGTVVALEPAALAVALGPAMRIEASREATVHFETVPLPIGTEGTPPTVAAPTLNAFQQDMIVVRCIIEAAWCLRQEGMVAVLTGALWGASPT